MKTAISIPDSLYERAEKFARSNRMSRSELYQQALAAYLTEASATEITEKLDALYGEEKLRVPRSLRQMQLDTLKRSDETW